MTLKLFVSSTSFRKRSSGSSFKFENRCKSTFGHPIDGNIVVSTYSVSQEYSTCSSSHAGSYARRGNGSCNCGDNSCFHDMRR